MLNSQSHYSKAGVDIDKGDELVERIKQKNPFIGGFAGLYALDESRFLVGCTDGVGTKIELSLLAAEMGFSNAYENLAQDLVAMCVNDLVVCGAKPLFFLDYYATGKLDVDAAHQFIQGIEKACKRVGCVLLGGETAEMPGFYEGKKFDIAGFSVGLVERTQLIDGSQTNPGDVIIGLPSNGFHANGYSLIRSLIRDHQIDLNQMVDENETLLHYLTRPTHLYVNETRQAIKAVPIKAMAHITGGGLANIDRSLKKNLRSEINTTHIPTHFVMKMLQQIGNVGSEAYRVWNMGLGFVFIVDPQHVDSLLATLPHSFVTGFVAPK